MARSVAFDTLVTNPPRSNNSNQRVSFLSLTSYTPQAVPPLTILPSFPTHAPIHPPAQPVPPFLPTPLSPSHSSPIPSDSPACFSNSSFSSSVSSFPYSSSSFRISYCCVYSSSSASLSCIRRKDMVLGCQTSLLQCLFIRRP